MSEFDNQDANDEGGSSSTEATDQNGSGAEQEARGQHDNVPFHEHPRFKELITERSQFKSQLDELNGERERYSSEIQKLQQQLEAVQKGQAGPSKQEALFAKLDEIDPDLAATMRELHESSKGFKTLQEQLEQEREEKMQERANSARDNLFKSIEKLHEDNKVPNELRAFIKSQTLELARANPKLPISQIDTLYKQAHGEMTKYLDSYKREERKSYTEAKKKDSAPALTKGVAEGKGKGKSDSAPEGVDPREWMRSQIVKAAIRSKGSSADDL